MGEILVRQHLKPGEGRIAPDPPVLDLAGSAPLPDLDLSLPTAPIDAHRSPRSASGSEGLTIETSGGTLVVLGDSLLCPCPECAAPLSIRLWLLIVDCWRCGTAVELTEEQQRAVREALAERQAAEGAAAASAGTAPGSAPSTDKAELENARPAAGRPARRRTAAADELAGTAASTTARPARPAPRAPSAPAPLREAPWYFQLGPAWIVSLLVHLLLILLLALITFRSEEAWESITLSTFVSPEDTEGGVRFDLPEDRELTDELPVPDLPDLSDQEVREVVARADQDARELLLDPSPDVPLPDVREVRERVAAGPTGNAPSFAGRDPRLRAELVQREGGTLLTEAAVARGLRWLAEHQNRDGSWSLNDWERSSNPTNTGDAAATSLALLPFLGAGQTHEYGLYKSNVAKGLQWLVRNQQRNGDLRAGIDDTRGMYAHGQGTIVLVEALAMTGDERFRDPAQRAVDFIVAAQHDEGGWRYRPGESGDTSVLGWQLMALQSARAPGTGLRVPDDTLKLAGYYLDLCASENGARYAYMPVQRPRPTPSMTAEALLCRMYLGWTRDDPRLRSGIVWLETEHPPQRTRENLYYWYYATQVFHHLGGPSWDHWNVEMRDQLVNAQVKTGKNAGSWDPERYEFGPQGGRIFTTSLGVCILEVYYRHLPLFKQLEIDADSSGDRP